MAAKTPAHQNEDTAYGKPVGYSVHQRNAPIGQVSHQAVGQRSPEKQQGHSKANDRYADQRANFS